MTYDRNETRLPAQVYGRHGTGPCFVGFLCCFGCGGGVRGGVAPEETAVLVGWRRRSDNHVLVRMKAEAVLHASRGVDAGIIAETVERAERTERTVQEWPADWRATRMRRVPAGHAGNRDAVEPVRVRKQEPETILARPLGARGPDPPHAAPERTAHQAVRGPAEDVPVLLRRPPPTSRTVAPYPTEQNRNTWRTTLALDLLQRETEAGKIAVVPDNARPHHARALTGLHEPGRLLERITPIHPPPYAPDHNPVEHVRNAAKSNIATIQRETPEETFGAFASYVTGRTVDYDFEHLPLRETRNDFVS